MDSHLCRFPPDDGLLGTDDPELDDFVVLDGGSCFGVSKSVFSSFSTLILASVDLEDSSLKSIGRKEGNVLFNDALNTFYLWLYGIRHMVKDHSGIVGNETRCRHIGYSF